MRVTMTSLCVIHMPVWVIADLDADPRPWAEGYVRQRAQEEDVDLEHEFFTLLTDGMVWALNDARNEDPPPVMTIFLYPVTDDPIITSVTVRAEPVDEDVTFEDLADELRLPTAMLEQPRIEEFVETLSGPALHMIQRYRQPVDLEVEEIQEHEAFLWILQDDDGPILVMLSTSYVDLLAAAEWRPDLLALATSLTMEPDQET
jgi:hypothetical protein